MYSKIYDFCKVRNFGTVLENDPAEPTPRVKWLIQLLDSERIEYDLDKFITIADEQKVTCYNIILRGNSNRMVVAHHDVYNCETDNANDNSCSVINAIMIKKLMPDIHVILLDGEECGGIGAERVSRQILDGEFGKIEWVLNFELTGKGGKYFFIGDYPGTLSAHIQMLFDCPVVYTPGNDSDYFRDYGIDSCVINPVPPLPEGEMSGVKYGDTYLDFSYVYHCHSPIDTVDTIDPVDMQEFVEDVVLKILAA